MAITSATLYETQSSYLTHSPRHTEGPGENRTYGTLGSQSNLGATDYALSPCKRFSSGPNRAKRELWVLYESVGSGLGGPDLGCTIRGKGVQV